MRVKMGLAFMALLLLPVALSAQERPYFVTYDHHMEEPGNLEIAYSPTIGVPRTANGFVSSLVEIGYGVKGWWTTEVYLAGQSRT